jgi:hypothetical protein
VHVNGGVPFPSTALTFEAWVKPTAGNYAQFFTAGFINLFVAINNNGSGIEWGVGNGSNWQIHTAAGSISLNAWHYIAVTYDGATMIAYVDGAAIGSQGAVTTLAVPGDYNIGGRPQNTFLNGILGPERLSSTVHTAATIAGVWSNAAACPAP